METITVLTIPTGLGAEIGGYAGDGGKIARMFAKNFKVIVNPNVVNAGILSAITDNMLYVEGFALDMFLNGEINLVEQKGQNKIGIIFDKSIPKGILDLHLNTIEAMKIVKGYDIPFFEITEEPVGIALSIDKSGISTGGIKNEKTLYKAAEKLVKKGANALAVVCFFGEECEDENYDNGEGVDPIGGIEAVISHYLTKEFMLPCAHSPAFSDIDIPLKKMNPKVASEFISSTYLPCILDGLNKAPALKKLEKTPGEALNKTPENREISNKDVKALVVPNGALGSKGVLGAAKAGIEICAVKNNVVLSIDCKTLKQSGIMKTAKEFASYEDVVKYIRKKYEEV